MLNDEIEIMRDAFCFLRDHNDPLANDSGRLVAYWERTAFDTGRLAEKWSGHTLAVVVLAVLFYKLLWKRLLHIKLFKKVDDLVHGMVDGVKSILHLGPRRTLMFIGYSVVIYLLYILGGYIILQAFTQTASLDFGAAFVVYLFGTVGMTFSQGGIGVYPVLVQLALDIYGIGMEVGTACGWLLWGSQQAAIIVVGAAYLVYFSLMKRKQKA